MRHEGLNRRVGNLIAGAGVTIALAGAGYEAYSNSQELHLPRPTSVQQAGEEALVSLFHQSDNYNQESTTDVLLVAGVVLTGAGIFVMRKRRSGS